VAALDDFAPDYFAARDRFMSRAIKHGWKLSSHTIAARGPNGEPLTIDTAVSEPVGARGTVIVTSGLHGVEGFLGSAVQSRLLAEAESPGFESPPVRLVFIHALNPFGFAWLRRCNEDNVDLNRNFLAEGKEYRGSPDGYAMLDPLLNRPSPPSPWEPFRLRAVLAILRWGTPVLKRAIASGQYDYPQGLFFGGHRPCETARVVQQRFDTWLGRSGRVIHLDFHTGLGRWAELQLLSDVPFPAADADRLERELGRRPVAGTNTPTVQYSARGSIGEWCANAGAERDYRYLCAEFGTYPPVKMLTTLRAENREHHWGQRDTPGYRRAKDRLSEAFCPKSEEWRERTLTAGIDLVHRAICAVAT
jgi:hypothetical protein